MKKFTYFFVVLFFILFNQNLSKAQSLDWVNQTKPGLGGTFTITGEALDPAGSVYAIGYFNGPIDFDPGPGNYTLTTGATINNSMFIRKLNSNGNFQWAYKIENGNEIQPLALTSDPSGNIYIAGYFSGIVDFDPSASGIYNLNSSSTTLENYFQLKLDSNANFKWAYNINTNIMSVSHFIKIDVDDQGNLLTSTRFIGTVDFDPGTPISNLNTSSSAYFLQKLDSSGNFVWAEKIPNYVSFESDPNQNIIFTGYLTIAVDLDPGPGFFILGGTGIYGTYISKLNSLGQFVWAKQIQPITTSMTIYANNLTVDGLGNIITSGTYNGLVDFNPSPLQDMLPFMINGSFVLKWDSNGNFVWVKALEGSFSFKTLTDTAGNVYSCSMFGATLDADPSAFVYPLSGDTNCIASPMHMGITKWDPNGVLTWAEGFYATDPLAGVTKFDFRVNNSGDVYVQGLFNKAVDFNPSIIIDTLNASNGAWFTLKLNPCFAYTNSTYNVCDSIHINGQTYSITGVYTQNYSDINGCDSNLVLNINVSPSYHFNTYYSSCDSFQFASQTYYADTIINFTYATTQGCDSIYSNHINILSTTSSTNLTHQACNSFTYNAQTYTVTGIYNSIFIGSTGCDSNVTLHLTIDTTILSSFNASSCTPYLWNSNVYNTSGTYSQTFIGSTGCDSIATIHLTILPSSLYSYADTACQQYTFCGNTYTVSGIYTNTTTNSAGCDSVVQVSLLISPSSAPTYSYMNLIECNSALINGVTYSSSGNYTQNYINSQGCDSILNITLNIINIDQTCSQVGALLSSNNLLGTYQWVQCPSYTPIIGATNQSYIATANGNYAVIIHQGSCVDTSICYSVIGIGITELPSSSMSISPNPTSTTFNIQLDQPTQNATLKIISLTGDIVLEKNKLNGTHFNIDISSFATGLYIIELNDEHHILRSKIRKE